MVCFDPHKGFGVVNKNSATAPWQTERENPAYLVTVADAISSFDTSLKPTCLVCSCQLPVASLPPVSVVCLRELWSGQVAHVKQGGWVNLYQPYSLFFNKQLLRVGYKPSSSLAVGWDHSECISQIWIKLTPYFVFYVSCWWFTVTNLPAMWESWIPGSGRSPGEGNGNPLQYSCLENSMDRGAWQTAVHEFTMVTYVTHTHTHTHTCTLQINYLPLKICLRICL